MQTILIILIALVVLGGGYFYWSQSSGTDLTVNIDQNEGLTPNTNTGDTLPVGDPNAGNMDAAGNVAPVKELTVTNQGFVFDPKTISVKKGDRVKITYTNGGGTHDFRVDGYNVGTNVLQGGQSQTIEFTADKVGSFEFYCSVGNHRAMGMKGTLTVTE